MEELQDFIVFNTPASVGENQNQKDNERIWIWSTNSTKLLLDLYKNNKPKVGTRAIKNLKRLWEVIAEELSNILNACITASQCENKWRVLERAYKKHLDNQNKTGQGRKYFEYLEDMDETFKGKRNVQPILLFRNHPSLKKVNKRRSNPVLNKNIILANMRYERKEYNIKRLQLEQEKLEVQKHKLNVLKERNVLLKERNEMLKNRKSAQCYKKFCDE